MPERLRQSRRIYAGHVVNLRIDEVELPSGRVAEREIVEHRGAVAFIPLLDSHEVLLVRQFRLAAARYLLEIPAGSIESGETVIAALERELAEEVGMRANRVDHLCSFFPSPGFLTEEVHIYLAQELSPYRLPAEEEELEVLRLPFGEAVALVARGEIRDAKSIIGLLVAAQRVHPA